ACTRQTCLLARFHPCSARCSSSSVRTARRAKALAIGSSGSASSRCASARSRRHDRDASRGACLEPPAGRRAAVGVRQLQPGRDRGELSGRVVGNHRHRLQDPVRPVGAYARHRPPPPGDALHDRPRPPALPDRDPGRAPRRRRGAADRHGARRQPLPPLAAAPAPLLRRAQIAAPGPGAERLRRLGDRRPAPAIGDPGRNPALRPRRASQRYRQDRAPCDLDEGPRLGLHPRQPPSLPRALRPGLHLDPALIGVNKNFFAGSLDSKVTLETKTFNAGGDAVTAILSDSIDATFVGPNPTVNAFAQSHGQAIRVVAGATSGGALLVVKPSIKSPAELKGKKIADPQLGATQDVALRWYLKSQGLNAGSAGGGDVSVVPQDNAQTLTAFKQGQIAGAWLPEPWASRLVVEGGAKVLVDERDLWPQGRFVTTNLIVRSDFLAAHP